MCSLRVECGELGNAMGVFLQTKRITQWYGIDEVTARIAAWSIHIRNTSSPWLPLAKFCVLRCSTTRCITGLPTSSQPPVSDPDPFSYVPHRTSCKAPKFLYRPVQQDPTVSKRCPRSVPSQQHDVAGGFRVHRAGRPKCGCWRRSDGLREVLLEALQRRLCGSSKPCERPWQVGRIGRNAMPIAQERHAICSASCRPTSRRHC